MKILDTDFLIALLRKDPEVEATIKRLEESRDIFGTTIFSVHEVLFGVSNDDMNLVKETQRLFDSIPVLHYDFQAMRHALSIIHSIDRKGRRIGIFDELIAGICTSRQATLITRNKQHFERVEGLTIESW